MRFFFNQWFLFILLRKPFCKSKRIMSKVLNWCGTVQTIKTFCWFWFKGIMFLVNLHYFLPRRMSSTERIILTALCYVLLGLIVDGRSSNDLTCRVINSKRYFLDADELRRCSNDTCPVCPENESECRRPYHEQCQICCQQGYRKYTYLKCHFL